jgi:hypothetical protein
MAGASDSGTINVTIKFQQLFAVDETAVVAVAVALGLGADETVRQSLQDRYCTGQPTLLLRTATVLY